MGKLVTAIAVALLLSGCSSGPQSPNEAHTPAPPGAKQLSGDEIHQALIGRKLQSETAKGQPFWETLSPDGTAAIQIAKDPVQKGVWTIANDVICVTYQQYGKECNTVHSEGSSVWLVDETSKKTNNKYSVH
jgi:starvation-inducible outer membrane lipoprotein